MGVGIFLGEVFSSFPGFMAISWLWLKNGAPKWNPGRWTGRQPAQAQLLHFEPRPIHRLGAAAMPCWVASVTRPLPGGRRWPCASARPRGSGSGGHWGRSLRMVANSVFFAAPFTNRNFPNKQDFPSFPNMMIARMMRFAWKYQDPMVSTMV